MSNTLNAQERAEWLMLETGRYKDGRDTIVYYGGDFYESHRTHYEKIDPKLMRKQMYKLDASATPFQVEQAMSVLADKLCIGPGMPQQLGGNVPEDVKNLLPMQNGLLHVPSLSLYAADLDMFVTYCLPFAYDPDAPTPERWMRFLDELFPDGDEESKQLLQEWFGLCLLCNTSLQKMLLIIGPKRSGKGTIQRVITGLIGQHWVAATTMQSLSGQFGLSPLIGKPLAIMSDVRLDRRTPGAGVQALLNISGEDAVSINIKHKDLQTMTLPTRLMLLSNEIPLLPDSSGALASRFMVLQIEQSFYRREDTQLTGKLLAELPGILNWALRGYGSLMHRGRFVQPKSGQETADDLFRLGSPIQVFVDECCEVGLDCKVSTNHLYNNCYQSWCEGYGIRPLDQGQFGKQLKAAIPKLTKHRPAGKGPRILEYHYVQVKSVKVKRSPEPESAEVPQ